MAVYTLYHNTDKTFIQLQPKIDVFVDWAGNWKLVYKTKSSEVLFFTRQKEQGCWLHTGRVYLPRSLEVKCIGVFLEAKVTKRKSGIHTSTVYAEDVSNYHLEIDSTTLYNCAEFAL